MATTHGVDPAFEQTYFHLHSVHIEFFKLQRELTIRSKKYLLPSIKFEASARKIILWSFKVDSMGGMTLY